MSKMDVSLKYYQTHQTLRVSAAWINREEGGPVMGYVEWMKRAEREVRETIPINA
jgi:hypothetical protein